MAGIKSLAKETLIYGLSYSLGRVINFLLVTVYLTRVFSEDKAYFSIYSELYFLIALFLGILGLRMETGFFRFASDEKYASKIYPLASQLVLLCCAAFMLFVYLGIDFVENILQYPDLRNLIYVAAWIAALDVISALPFARIRYEKKPLRYAWIKLSGLLFNVILVLIFLTTMQGDAGEKLFWVMAANLIGSIWVLLCLIPEMKASLAKADWSMANKLLKYVSPLLLVTLSFIVIQYGSTSILKYFLPGSIIENLETSSQYNAAVRLAVIMNLFVTAFNYAAEPFFFRSSKQEQARPLFAKVSLYFILACSLIYLMTCLFINDIALLLDKNFRGELQLVSILLLANILMGLYSNISSWYKLSDNNHQLALVSLSGMLLMIVLNIWWIPYFGNRSAAYANLVAYGFICAMAYYQGQKKFPIPYEMMKMALWLGLAVLLIWCQPLVYTHLGIKDWLARFTSLAIIVVYAFAAYVFVHRRGT
ncbi:MAG: polysaccharide biosynthesis C-terminal domain-containing protein [Saprospiraceae bacterium]|nr:polysaccharide biosynthesis C-terminal domain-containing protein [Saprospiraceae bacterium]